MRNEKLNMIHSVLLTMLRFALVEIRSSENSAVSKSLADIFHNIPLLLTLDFDEQRSERVFKSVYSKAEKHKMVNYIKSLEESALKSFLTNQ